MSDNTDINYGGEIKKCKSPDAKKEMKSRDEEKASTDISESAFVEQFDKIFKETWFKMRGSKQSK